MLWYQEWRLRFCLLWACRGAIAHPDPHNTAAFLMSPASSGINAQGLVVDAGMEINYFDKEVVRLAMRPEAPDGA